MKRIAVLAAAGLLALPAGAAAHGPPKIESGPEGPVNTRDVAFAFSYHEPAPGQTFQCRLDAGDWVQCGEIGLTGGEGEIAYEGLADGPHRFEVRRFSDPEAPLLSDLTPAERRFTVDTVAPAVTFTSDLEWTANEDAVFGCSLDGAEFAACVSPHPAVTAPGPHTLRIRATDAAGNESVAERAWEVPPPQPAPDPQPSGALPAGTVPTITVGRRMAVKGGRKTTRGCARRKARKGKGAAKRRCKTSKREETK